MQSAHPKPIRKPILNTSLPAQFRQIRIELAREPDHPEGDADVAYVIVAPLDRTTGSIRCFGESIATHAGSRDCGRTRRTIMVISFIARAVAGRSITIENTPDEIGFHFADERFVSGEYVSINEGGRDCIPTASHR